MADRRISALDVEKLAHRRQLTLHPRHQALELEETGGEPSRPVVAVDAGHRLSIQTTSVAQRAARYRLWPSRRAWQ
jgi:hypothetical protein